MGVESTVATFRSAFMRLLAELGTDRFDYCLGGEVLDLVDIDEIHAFEVLSTGTLPRTVVLVGFDANADKRAKYYLERLFERDTLHWATKRDGEFTELRVSTMANPMNRVSYGGGLFGEQVSVAIRTGDLWHGLDFFRRASKKPLSEAQYQKLAEAAEMFLPLIAKHSSLSIPRQRQRVPTVAQIEDRLLLHCKELTERELAVCARTIIGMTAEGIASEFAIKMSSVLTYRQRAYKRLNISRPNELLPLVWGNTVAG